MRLRAAEVGQPTSTLRDAMNRYEGHPYAIQRRSRLSRRQNASRTCLKIRRTRESRRPRGNRFVAPAETRSVASRLTPFWRWPCRVTSCRPSASLDTPTLKRSAERPSTCAACCAEEGTRRSRIYHAILADHVRGQIDQAGPHRPFTPAQFTSIAQASRRPREQNRGPRLPWPPFACPSMSLPLRGQTHS